MSADLDIILAAHGAGDGSEANALVRSCAQQLEATGTGARVTAAFHLGAPAYADALRGADRARVVVLPLLMSDGFFADRLRREMNRTRGGRNAPVLLRPLGIHPRFVRMVVETVAAAVRESAQLTRVTQIIVVAHGTTRHPGSGAAGRALADAIARRCALPAHAAYLDESPTIEELVASTPSDAGLLIVPLLLGGGEHAERDVPSRVTAAAASRGISADRVVYVEPMRGPSSLTGIIKRVVGEPCA